MQPQTSRHGPVAQLLIAWAPLSVILIAYAAARWVSAPLGTGDGDATNRLGFGLNVAGPARGDERLLGGIPSVCRQGRLGGGPARWRAAAAALA